VEKVFIVLSSLLLLSQSPSLACPRYETPTDIRNLPGWHGEISGGYRELRCQDCGQKFVYALGCFPDYNATHPCPLCGSMRTGIPLWPQTGIIYNAHYSPASY